MDTIRMEEILSSEDFSEHKADGVFLGLELMRKYIPTATIEAAEHDMIFSVGIDELCKTDISEEAVMALFNYGWCIEYDSLAHFA